LIPNRRVYFLSGFDPRGASFYHRLYREEARKQARLNGAKISISKRQRASALFHKWTVQADWQGQSTHTDYQFLSWDDLIRKNWVDSLVILIARSMLMYVWHIRTGLLRKFKKAGRGPFFSSIFPLVFIVLSSVVISLSAVAVACTLNWMIANIFVSMIGVCAMLIWLIKRAKKMGDKLGVWWILQTYLFLATWGKKPIADMNDRIQQFADQIIADAKESSVDEVLIVGHCVGSILAVAVLAKIIEKNDVLLEGKLKLVTLGQCIPYVSYPSTATAFRQDLVTVVENEHYPWVDMGARADPLCFDQVDPAKAEGMSVSRRRWPITKAVRPYHMYSSETYEKLKKNKLRIHFQYLMSSELLTDYDYFRLTTGPEPLAVQAE